jgi:WD40 repeat protein
MSIGFMQAEDASAPTVEKLPDGTSVMILKGHTEPVLSVAFSPNGEKIVTASADITVRIWDAESGKQLKVIVGKRTDGTPPGVYNFPIIKSVSFSPDGKMIVIGDTDDAVHLWDVASLNKLHKFRLGGKFSDYVESVAFSLDGKKIVAAGGWKQFVSGTQKRERIYSLFIVIFGQNSGRPFPLPI